MSAGKALRDEGMSAVLAADTAPHRSYGEIAREVIDQFIEEGRTFTSEDVRAEIPSNVEAHHPNVLPAVLGSLASAGRIRRVGEYHSTRLSRRYGRNSFWKAAE